MTGRESKAATAEAIGLWRTLLSAISPLGLRQPHATHPAMPAVELAAARLSNQRFLQQYMGVYITRSARLTLFGFVGLQAGLYLFGPVVAVPAGSLMLGALLHLVTLLFWKQHLDNRLGPCPPRE